MKLIEQSYEVIDRTAMDATKLIELCGRTCYKSEDKITEGSARDFVFMLASKRHLSVLEHGVLAFSVPYSVQVDFKLLDHEITRYLNIATHDEHYVVSGNLRAWLEFLQKYQRSNDGSLSKVDGLKLKFLIHQYCPAAYEACFGEAPHETWNNAPSGIRVLHEADMDRHEKWLHAYRTVRFVTNRGVTHELVRHRPVSYSQESTRYVNYGGKEIEFIKPVWWGDERWNAHVEKRSQIINDKVVVFRPAETSYPSTELLAMITHFEGCAASEVKYNQLLKWGWRPEQAREVLPNALKTEIVVTTNLKEWHHILALRTSTAAHPQVRALMDGLKEKLPGGV